MSILLRCKHIGNDAEGAQVTPAIMMSPKQRKGRQTENPPITIFLLQLLANRNKGT
jgi:hypothetical protein